MKITKTPLDGLLLIEMPVHPDSRGFFMENWNRNEYTKNGIHADFLQDNVSYSNKNVLRGLHFQTKPNEQGKLVRVLKGSVLDVAVDIRKDSSSFGKHFLIELNEKNKIAMWIPPGFAHGFLSLEEGTIFTYKCSGPYVSESEVCLLWNDPTLGIDWKIKNPILSSKDKKGLLLSELRLDAII